MQRASVVVTASVPRKYFLFLTLISGVLIALGIGIVYKADPGSRFSIANESFTAEYAITDAEKARGLSGRPSISEESVMVFSWDQPRQRCIWMKDMQFSIDIVWLDASKRVAAMEQNVSPGSYPRQFCHDGQHVLEFKAGTVANIGLKSGDTAQF